MDKQWMNKKARKVRTMNEFVSLNPHKWLTVQGHSFYECPLRGSDEGLIMKTPDDQLFVTDMYDPDKEELEDVISNGEFENYYTSWTY